MPKRRTAGWAFLPGTGPGGVRGVAGAGTGSAGAGRGAGGAASTGPPPAVTVRAWSRARGREEDVVVEFTGPDAARVCSASGNVYDVRYAGEEIGCTCPDYRFRRRLEGTACRHILAARSAAYAASVSDEEMAAATSARVPLTARAGFDASRAAARAREDASAASGAAAAMAAEPLAEHEVSLIDDAAFADLLARAERGDVPYEYENVLDGSRNTFGVEIEFVGGNREAIARELYERGYIPHPYQRGYHAPRVPGMWSFETDGSVDGEVVSPVFRDTPEAWRQIEEICEIIRRHGGRAAAPGRSVGLHVHIGREPIDHDSRRWQALLGLVRRIEDLFYRFGAGGESEGRHRGTPYAVPLAQEPMGVRHYTAVNGRTATIEFRYFNGTLDPRQIQAYVRIAHATVRASARMADASAASGIPAAEFGTMARRGDPAHSVVRSFLDTVFTRARDKLAALWLYATSRWQAV